MPIKKSFKSEELLSKLSLLTGQMTQAQKDELLLHCTVRYYKVGDIVSGEGDVADRLFFIFEGDMTGYDILKDVGGTLLPLLAANQSTVHHMSTQILSWKENDLSGLMIACYYISSLYGKDNMQRFRDIVQDIAVKIWSDPEIRTRSIEDMVLNYT